MGSMEARKGFTLIETMIVIAIIAILASISISAYNRYMAKVIISEGITTAAPLQKAIQEFYMLKGYLPGRTDFVPLPSGYTIGAGRPFIANPTPNIQSIAWWNDTDPCGIGIAGCDDIGTSQVRQIEIWFANPTRTATAFLGNHTFMLTAAIGANKALYWLCMPYPPDTGFDSTLLPKTCHNAALDH